MHRDSRIGGRRKTRQPVHLDIFMYIYACLYIFTHGIHGKGDEGLVGNTCNARDFVYYA